jgi:diguanylate cyclase (GGDEF)-like protein
VAHVIVVSRDITARRRAEEDLHRAARTDPLTGLANRTALVEDLEAALEASPGSSRLTAVLLVDLDHFKFVNDSLGHSVGDLFLQRAADRIRHCIGPADLVARHGGDEFVIVLHDLEGPGEATEVAERIIDRFRLPLVCEGTDVSTTASIGIALGGDGGRDHDAHDLVREADTAMFVAKDRGRDGYAVFDDSLHAAAQERFRIANELRSALGRQELAVWYQPEVDLADGRILAVEALLRWRHPSGVVYPAGRFIDIAAETGLIVDIGHWVLDQVCAQAARWGGGGPTIRVNLAPRQLGHADLLDRLDEAVARHGIDGARLCVEITETALLHDNSTVRANLAGLSARGVAVAIDDFGTGYASLTYLRRYRIDVIKIDRSFVTHIADRDRDHAVAAAIVSLGHHLGMTVTAEGIEHPEQAEVLRSIGCGIGQGYLYGAAVPVEEIDARLDDR